MSMELTPSTPTGRYYYMYLFIFLPASCQHSIHLPKGLHFLLKSKAVLSYLSSKQRGQNFIAKMPQKVSIFSYISHKSSLKEWTTSELGYFPLHNGRVIPVHYYYEYILKTMKIVQKPLLELQYTSVLLP